jgi:exosome complex exonuclease RRP6
MASRNDFEALQEDATSSLVNITKLVAQLVAEDLSYQTALDPSLGKTIDQQKARLLGLAQKLLDNSASGASLRAPPLGDAEDVDNNWRGIVDTLDSMLEKADTCMDEYTGMIKRSSDSAQVEVSFQSDLQNTCPDFLQQQKKKKKRNPWQLESKYRTRVDTVRPQVNFDPRPDNWTRAPFKPFLETKPHATIPLAESLETFTNGEGSLE